jgi:hypothetical protein
MSKPVVVRLEYVEYRWTPVHVSEGMHARS